MFPNGRCDLHLCTGNSGRGVPDRASPSCRAPRHGVSANASETKPAKLLAVFVVDTNETELTIPWGTEV